MGDRKMNNSSWCCEKIQEKIEEYKHKYKETQDPGAKRQLETIIKDLEEILYG